MGEVGEVHTGDEGTDFLATCYETHGDPDNPDQFTNVLLEIDDLVDAEMTWTKPDGSTIVRTHAQGVVLFTDGFDGNIHFLNDETINPGQTFSIDQGENYWSLEGWVKLADGSKLHCKPQLFMVRGKNL